MPRRRFTHENTIGATQALLDSMNEQFEELAGGIRNEELRDQAAEMVVKDHGGRWNGGWKPIFD
jgi:hypothetical protein